MKLKTVHTNAATQLNSIVTLHWRFHFLRTVN